MAGSSPSLRPELAEAVGSAYITINGPPGGVTPPGGIPNFDT